MPSRSEREVAELLADPSLYRVLGTGSRDWGDEASRRKGRGRASVWMPLDKIRARHDRIAVFNGKCPSGADQLVSEWAEEYKDDGVVEIPFYANWTKNGHYAGSVRNGEMVAAGPVVTLVWANPCRRRRPWCPPGEHPSHGTADCVRQARQANIPVYFCPSGLSW